MNQPRSVRKIPGPAVAVRLVHKPTGRAVTDAVIVQTRIDMGPEGMAEMASSLTPLPSPEPGVYAFKTDLAMQGLPLDEQERDVEGTPLVSYMTPKMQKEIGVDDVKTQVEEVKRQLPKRRR